MELDDPKAAYVNEYTRPSLIQFIIKDKEINYHYSEKSWRYIPSIYNYWWIKIRGLKKIIITRSGGSNITNVLLYFELSQNLVESNNFKVEFVNEYKWT